MDSAMEQMVGRMLIQTCSSVRTKVRAIPYSSLKQKKAIEGIVEELNEAIDQSCRVFQDVAQAAQ